MRLADGVVIDAFIDLRSPYSYLTIEPARELARRTGVHIDWWPYITDFRSAYGGEVEQRPSREVAKLKYLYMDCRRLAKQQGRTIRATQKLWDAKLASQALLFAKTQNKLWEFCLPLLERFWAQDFDLESVQAIEALLVQIGLPPTAWQQYLAQQADALLAATLARAERLGVFGAPTFIYRGELFWGGDRLELLAHRLGIQTPKACKEES
ncbi:DsbA family protein [Pseudomonas putida]|uniref:DsbA family protein n=1 Tax=Pseudomonas putida TaxID=303 RepID=UPI0034D658F0